MSTLKTCDLCSKIIIRLEVLFPEQTIVETSCHHTFHLDCYNKTKKTSNECPFCQNSCHLINQPKIENKQNQLLGDTESCSICLEPMRDQKHLIARTSCNHIFHKQCTEKLSSCPYCTNTISKLKYYRWNKNAFIPVDIASICLLCTNEFKNPEQVIRTYCDHNFHKICLKEWHSKDANCPSCKTNIAIGGIIELLWIKNKLVNPRQCNSNCQFACLCDEKFKDDGQKIVKLRSHSAFYEQGSYSCNHLFYSSCIKDCKKCPYCSKVIHHKIPMIFKDFNLVENPSLLARIFT